MRNYLKYLLIGIVFIGISKAWAGSYDDFFIAIKRDNPKTIVELLQRGFDPNTPDPKGQYGLMLALAEPAPKVAAALIAWPKTDVEARNSKDESALMMASLRGQEDLAAALIARGAHVNKTGWTPLHYAATNGHLNIMRRLLEAHAYIDAESPNGTTPLMMAAQYGSTDAVKLLLEAGADPTLRNQLKLNAIDFARRASRDDAVELITKAMRTKQPTGRW